MGKARARKRRVQKVKSLLPAVLYIAYHEDGDSSWFQAEENLADFNDEGIPICAYTKTGAEGKFQIKRAIDYIGAMTNGHKRG